jgi:hypothetical protein
VRLFLFSLAIVCALAAFGQQVKPPGPGNRTMTNEPKVCSIPLLEVPHFQNPNKRFNRFSIPAPPHPDHLQVAPPAPPCRIDQNLFRPKREEPKPFPGK